MRRGRATLGADHSTYTSEFRAYFDSVQLVTAATEPSE